MLIYDPDKRYTAKQCLVHPYFSDLVAKEEKLSKMSLVNFRRNPLMLMSFNNNNMVNDSVSFAKVNESSNIQTFRKDDKEAKTILPEIKIKNIPQNQHTSSIDKNNILEDFSAKLRNFL